MTTQILLAGFGGQGLLFAGKFLAYAGLIEGKQVSWLPSYGPEMRGGTANCSVILSDEPIGSPIVLAPDILVAMNLPSFMKFAPAVQPGGLLLADSAMFAAQTDRTDVRAFYLPATQMAYENGMQGLANILLVGKLLHEANILAPKTARAAMEKTIPPRKAALLEKNLQALQYGMRWQAEA
ncbi:MAG: 2-oxoacid:acceptor oxidoreductase family protein [Oscillospiraceae bacterium]|jgi:2-oxoglutarate ferredoxin oxidoreductase subunit gamma|nr:2-oxoacid:acceptor oxidoreductase family protein [Oscillospiraceae bacterium]